MPNQDFNKAGLELVEAFGWLYGWESVTLSVFVKGFLPADAKIVNIGAGVGTSVLSMTIGNPQAKIIEVDISSGGPNGGLENTRNAFMKAPGLPLPKQVLSDSSTAGRNWTENDLDFVFIDGDHSSVGLTKDIEAWLPHVKRGGYIGFHDYQAVVWAAVKQVVDEMMVGCEPFLEIDTVKIFRVPELKKCECKVEPEAKLEVVKRAVRK
jgi:hypothetical protein